MRGESVRIRANHRIANLPSEMQQTRNFRHGAASSSSSHNSNHQSGAIEQSSEFYNGNEAVICHCREVCRIATSWTLSNPGRRFHGCINYGSPKACNYFMWYDPPMPQPTKSMMVKFLKSLRKAEEENNVMKTEIWELKKEKRRMQIEIETLKATRKLLMGAVVCICILFIAILLGSVKERNLELKMLN